MQTPICDFLEEYQKRDALRLHMPGHKGQYGYGADITEIEGADCLGRADGIIWESEKNAGALFGADTFYSTEGSSQCIRAMLYLACLYAAEKGEKPHILAGRNAHKAFVRAAALLDFSLSWLHSEEKEGHLSCTISPEKLEAALGAARYTAVYITSPDYLGAVQDIASLSAVCRKYGVLLLVDNAHGAYRKFLSPSAHPIDLGAALCCDSAHKTLPVLTGGAYLHIAPSAPVLFKSYARRALALFGSTSPSYLILASLDRANAYLAEYPRRLSAFLPKVQAAAQKLSRGGYTLVGDEELKITIYAREYGYTGEEIARLLEKENCIAEFSDADYLVLMLTPETGEEGLSRLCRALLSVPRRAPLETERPARIQPERVCSPRTALFWPREELPAEECEGRILAEENTGCPPAVPLLMAGERVDGRAVAAHIYYGIKKCTVLRDFPEGAEDGKTNS